MGSGDSGFLGTLGVTRADGMWLHRGTMYASCHTL